MLTVVVQIVLGPRLAANRVLQDVAVCAFSGALAAAGRRAREALWEHVAEKRFECFAQRRERGGEGADEDFGERVDGEVDGCVGWVCVGAGVEGFDFGEFERRDGGCAGKC